MTIKIDGDRATFDKPDIDQWLKDGMGNWTAEQLREAFDHVKNTDHWKEDIDAVVDASMRDILEKAVPFMTGGDVFFEDLPDGRLRVTAPGYWSNGMDG